MIAAAAVLSALLAPIAFGEGGHWLILDRGTHRVRHLELPAKEVDDVALSADGKTVAFIAPHENAAHALFVWRTGEKQATLVESSGGQFAGLAIGPDGFIYYSHSPVLVGNHTKETFAQIFRIRPDGSQREQITDENGCHVATSFAHGKLTYIHTDCRTHGDFTRVAEPEQPEVLVTVASGASEAQVSPDGTSVLFAVHRPEYNGIVETRRAGAQHELVKLSGHMKQARPAYGRSKHEVLFQDDQTVWVLKGGNRTAIAKLTEEGSP